MLILASNSAIRKQLLHNAGIAFEVMSPDFDEQQIKATFDGENLQDLATSLAEGKALSVSRNRPANYIIGADQVLEFNGNRLSKPTSMDQAQVQLRELRNKQHKLHTAIALAHQGKTIYCYCDTATLTMRDFSDAFLKSYLAAEGAELLHCVGAYRFEGLGLQLFENVSGSYHTILGLPFLPLLQKLRERGLIQT